MWRWIHCSKEELAYRYMWRWIHCSKQELAYIYTCRGGYTAARRIHVEVDTLQQGGTRLYIHVEVDPLQQGGYMWRWIPCNALLAADMLY
jgi:hypothetical protein